jgi:hypothetical protein
MDMALLTQSLDDRDQTRQKNVRSTKTKGQDF